MFTSAMASGRPTQGRVQGARSTESVPFTMKPLSWARALTSPATEPTIPLGSAAPSGSGTVTSIATTSPITGLTITRCHDRLRGLRHQRSSLTANQLVIAVLTGQRRAWVPGTTTTVLHGNGSGAPAFSAIVNADITNATIDLIPLTGLLPLANGGTAANLQPPTAASSTQLASAGAILAGTATANQVLLSGTSAAPAWSTATYPGSCVGQISSCMPAQPASGAALPARITACSRRRRPACRLHDLYQARREQILKPELLTFPAEVLQRRA